MSVTFPSGGKNIPTTVFKPVPAANGGLIVLACGSDGLVDNNHGPWKTMIEGYASDLASEGFVAAIPDYFERTGTKPSDFDLGDPAYLDKVLAHRGDWQAVLRDAVSELPKISGMPKIDSAKLGYVGYSLGGHLCARAATSVRALVTFFAPRLDGLGLSGFLSLQGEMHHGANDFLDYQDNAVLIQKESTSHGAACKLWPAYTGAVHGFVGNDAANVNARRESHDRTLTFFRTCF